MSLADKKGIVVASGFKLQAEALLDVREAVETITERDALVTEHAVTAGLKVYVKQNKTLYVYNGAGWDELSKGSGYTHPTGSGYNHIPEGGSSGQVLKWKADGEAQWAAEKSYSKATAAQDGLMAKEDKEKLDSVEEGANKTVVDSAISSTSTNPLQNKAIKAELDKKLNSALKGANNGVAELDQNGKVPTSQLPSFVDDVIEGYYFNSKFYKESGHTNEITGETGKIYVDLSTNKTYRWSGTAFAVISETLALGETSSTAYRGDRGKIAYDHSQEAHAPSDAEPNVQADWAEDNTGSDAYIKNKPTSLPANGGNANTVNNHTVQSDVPANAVFTDTKPVTMKGATESTAGSAGYAPAPGVADRNKYLRGDGVWQTPPNTTYNDATQSAHGLMSAADKKKLDNLPQIYFTSELPEAAPAGSICFLLS